MLYSMTYAAGHSSTRMHTKLTKTVSNIRWLSKVRQKYNASWLLTSTASTSNDVNVTRKAKRRNTHCNKVVGGIDGTISKLLFPRTIILITEMAEWISMLVKKRKTTMWGGRASHYPHILGHARWHCQHCPAEKIQGGGIILCSWNLVRIVSSGADINNNLIHQIR